MFYLSVERLGIPAQVFSLKFRNSSGKLAAGYVMFIKYHAE